MANSKLFFPLDKLPTTFAAKGRLEAFLPFLTVAAGCLWLTVGFLVLHGALDLAGLLNLALAAPDVHEADLGGDSIFSRAFRGGLIVFSVLCVLLMFSVICWAIVVAKWIHLKRVDDVSNRFIKTFWESRSLNDLNSRLNDYPYSPAREVFRSGYSELVRGSQLRDQAVSSEMILHVSVDNLGRSLQKAKASERRRLEKYLSFLAICASVTPFIGLFGTVWGIMNAFERIANTGSASLAAVAPGISEALIATAFGLAAAIPAVIGYNTFQNKIRYQMVHIDGFASDFLNIIERYLVTERPRGQTGMVPAAAAPGETRS